MCGSCRLRREEAENLLGLTLSVKDVTNTGLTLVFQQSGGEATGELETGSDFYLEKRVDEAWERVEAQISQIDWTTEAYLIGTDASTEMKTDWSYLYGELPEGSYRIVKNVMDFRSGGDYDTYTVYAEFEIGE